MSFHFSGTGNFAAACVQLRPYSSDPVVNKRRIFGPRRQGGEKCMARSFMVGTPRQV
jgi:hypothetical protein